MKHKITAVLYGFLTWLIPFFASLFFFSKQGELTIPIQTFKSIMVVVGSLSSVPLLVRYFNRVDKDYLKNGIFLGILWYVMNIGLDILVLLPLSKMSFQEYFPNIGISYFSIPIYVIGVGILLQIKHTNKKV